jgi:hypothetical protein
MGYPTKVQLIQRKASEQWYINFPSAVAQAMEFTKGELVEWIIEDKANLTAIPVPRLGNALAEAILEAIPVQLLVADLAEAAGLPKCEFRYRQTDTKLPTA